MKNQFNKVNLMTEFKLEVIREGYWVFFLLDLHRRVIVWTAYLSISRLWSPNFAITFSHKSLRKYSCQNLELLKFEFCKEYFTENIFQSFKLAYVLL